MTLNRLILAVAAVDCTAMGLWAIVAPNDLFTRLTLAPPTDGFLWTWLGWLSLANALCLVMAAIWPGSFRGLTYVPWLGRMLSCGMWLWLLGTDRIAPASAPLWWLLAHDALWLVALTVILFLPSHRR